ncbi:MAG: hypothetical protein L6R36_009032 [Xanthoria steineri]|nr:MAG: hypothetical protein L6R36_009032 [Xanthoria steineri]
MGTITFGERFASNTDFNKPLGNLQSELTAQTLQTLRYVATMDVAFKTIDRKHYCSVKRLLKLVERDLYIDSDFTEGRAPFQDDMSFAAMWGCESYFRSRLSPKTSDKQLKAIFRNAVSGMKYNAYSPQISFPIPWLNSADIVLQMRQIPSLWDQFFLSVCEVFKKWLFDDDDPFGERAAWTQRCHEIIEKFLSLGAHPSQWIGHLIYVRSTSEQAVRLAMDRTPLAVIQWYSLQETDGILEIEAMLKSQGAVNQSRYSFCERKGMYYRIDTSHSKDLHNLLLSKPRSYSFCCAREGSRPLPHSIHFGVDDDDDEVFDALERIISTKEPLNSDTMYDEWAEEASDWSEDIHERETRPQQELQLSRRHSF